MHLAISELMWFYFQSFIVSFSLSQTAVTRAVLPAPLLITPPIIMLGLQRTGMFSVLPALRLPVEAVVRATDHVSLEIDFLNILLNHRSLISNGI